MLRAAWARPRMQCSVQYQQQLQGHSSLAVGELSCQWAV
jgi:hypothetical protein